MKPTDKVKIGKAGVEVTRLGLGGAPLSGMTLAGGLYGGSARDEAVRIIRRANDLGVGYFDTAPLYGNGRSEARFAAALSSLPRNSFVISTKVGRVLNLKDPKRSATVAPDGLPELEAKFDLTRDGILRSLDESLKRLKMDKVEILLLHDPDVENLEDAACKTAFPTMIRLREEGIVGAIGCGMNIWEMPARFIKRFPLDVVLLAGRYTLLDQQALPEFLPLCVEQGVKIVVGGPYNSGILARDLNKPVTFNYEPAAAPLVEKAKTLKAVCDRHKVDLKAAALQFVLAHPAIATAIPGAQTVSELEQNLSAVSVKIPVQLWAELKHEQLIPANAPTP